MATSKKGISEKVDAKTSRVSFESEEDKKLQRELKHKRTLDYALARAEIARDAAQEDVDRIQKQIDELEEKD